MVRNCVKHLKENNIHNAIFVVQKALTAPAKSAISEFNSLFHLDVFEVNVFFFLLLHLWEFFSLIKIGYSIHSITMTESHDYDRL